MRIRVKLIHWHAAEAREHARRLEAPGWTVDAGLPPAPLLLRALRRKPPAIVVISLDRLPAQGRDVAFVLRAQRSTAALPLVFVGGTPAKAAAVRTKLPDATFTSWRQLGRAVRRALVTARHPAPVAPAGAMAGYAGTPLPTKLGVKPHMSVRLLGPPPRFARTLGALPAGARLTDRLRRDTGLALWFVRSLREFRRGLSRAATLAARLPVWVVSPKLSGPLAADLSQNDIREACLAAGLVDYKVCAVDAAWSGLLFRRRRGPSDKLRR
ncbi:MAG TPA: hypothetical protein VLW52_05865 [Opitutaceae bacterium]|nr:hypothetical protein [Opitutaceae bacterium]